MILAFCLYKYFPYGGLQRDFLRIAAECHARGFKIRVYTLSWQGEIPKFIELQRVPAKSIFNHVKYQKFSRWVQNHLKQHPVNAVIGFNKMPHLDVYYAADPCYAAKADRLRGFWYRLGRRYRHFYAYEKSVFGEDSQTQILMISDIQKHLFQHYYQTPEHRLHLLPPGISPDRVAPNNADEIRKNFRQEFGLSAQHCLLVSIGSGFKTKGIDRSLKAIAALPPALQDRIRFIVIGQDDPRWVQQQVDRLKLNSQVQVLAGRDDIPRFLLGADLLLHPAYSENTGTVLLEALVAGLPVFVTDVCGYAHYIAQAQAGCVLASPFDQAHYNHQLQIAIEDQQQRSVWHAHALSFAKTADIFSMPQKATDIIEAVVRARG